MQVYIYRSSVKEGLYVYLPNHEVLAQLPAPVQKQLGEAEFAMELSLTADKKLVQEDATTVLANIAKQGFHLQMPRDIEHLIVSVADEADDMARKSSESVPDK